MKEAKAIETLKSALKRRFEPFVVAEMRRRAVFLRRAEKAGASVETVGSSETVEKIKTVDASKTV